MQQTVKIAINYLRRRTESSKVGGENDYLTLKRLKNRSQPTLQLNERFLYSFVRLFLYCFAFLLTSRRCPIQNSKSQSLAYHARVGFMKNVRYPHAQRRQSVFHKPLSVRSVKVKFSRKVTEKAPTP